MEHDLNHINIGTRMRFFSLNVERIDLWLRHFSRFSKNGFRRDCQLESFITVVGCAVTARTSLERE